MKEQLGSEQGMLSHEEGKKEKDRLSLESRGATPKVGRRAGRDSECEGSGMTALKR